MKSANKGNFRYSRTFADTSKEGYPTNGEIWREILSQWSLGPGHPLDQTLPLLKEGFPKPVVIAADSSLRALRSIGIDPDFVVSIDAEKLTIHAATQTTLRGLRFYPANRTRVGGTNGKTGAGFSRAAS